MKSELENLAIHYNQLAKEHGYSPHAVQQSSIETQEKRLSVLLEGFPDFHQSKILDFGCGTGHLLRLLKDSGFTGEYVGYDISQRLIEVAVANNPGGRFVCQNILEEPPEEKFDLVFISGVFNNDIGCNEEFLRHALTSLFNCTRTGLAFNCLSSYVDFQSPGLYYFSPVEVFDFCKSRLTTHVVLRHDYQIKPNVLPFEFTIYLHKTAHQPVASLK